MPCFSSSAVTFLNASISVSNAESQLALPLRMTAVFGVSVISSPNGSAVCAGATAGGAAAGVSAAGGGVAGAGVAGAAGAGVAAAGVSGVGVAGAVTAGGVAGDCAGAPDEKA